MERADSRGASLLRDDTKPPLQTHLPGEGHQRVSLRDAFGERREGVVLRVSRWDEDTAARVCSIEGDFRIVVLGEPPLEPLQPPKSTVICAPARPLEGPAAIREAAATYGAPPQRPALSLSAADARLLAQGKLYAPTELRTTAQEAFARGRARLELLARDLLSSQAITDYLEPLAIALAAPDAPARLSLHQAALALRTLQQQAQAGLTCPGPEAGPEADAALDRLSQLATAAQEPDAALACLRRVYPSAAALLTDVYLLRALAERPDEARRVLTMRSLLGECAVPPNDADLFLDKSALMEQLHFAVLVTEPERMRLARAALDAFRSRYRSRYIEHHRAYWTEAARLRAHLVEAAGQVEALARLNSLRELGPQVGQGALEAYRELMASTEPCPLIVGVENELATAAVCPACGLRLDAGPPSERATEILRRVRLAIERQMARLSSVAVRQLLERSDNPRVEQFLKVVQASQLSSLAEILDDGLVGYLRRFLVEASIGQALEPILSQVERGAQPNAEEARAVLREMVRILERSFRASGRALPPPRRSAGDGAEKHRR